MRHSTRRLTSLTAFTVAASLVVGACGHDGPDGLATPADSVPEAMVENASVSGGRPNLIAVTFHNRTGVELSLGVTGKAEGASGGGDSAFTVQLANGERVAAVMVNPLESFYFGFALQHTDWLGIDNEYTFFPGYGSKPSEGCDQNPPNFMDAGTRVRDRMWTVEFTDPNVQGYQGELKNKSGTFTCKFNMYTNLQILQRRNALSALTEAFFLYLDYTMIPIAAVGSFISDKVGFESGKEVIDNWTSELLDPEWINAKVIDIGNTLNDKDYLQSMKLTAERNPFTKELEIKTGMFMQKFAGSVQPNIYWDAVTEGLDDSAPVDVDVIEARSELAASGA